MDTMTMTDGRNDDNNKYTDVGLAKITKLLQQRVVTFSLGNHRTLLCFDNGVLNLKGKIFRNSKISMFFLLLDITLIFWDTKAQKQEIVVRCKVHIVRQFKRDQFQYILNSFITTNSVQFVLSLSKIIRI